MSALVICGWLISSGQSAHAADASSAPAPSPHNAVAAARSAAASATAHAATAHAATARTDVARTDVASSRPAVQSHGQAADAKDTLRSAGAGLTPALTGGTSSAHSSHSSASHPSVSPSSATHSATARSVTAQPVPARSARSAPGGTSLGTIVNGALGGLLTGSGQEARQAAGPIGTIDTTGLTGTNAAGAAVSGLGELPDVVTGQPRSIGPQSLPALEPLRGLESPAGLGRAGLRLPLPDTAGSPEGVLRQQVAAIRTVAVLVSIPAGAIWQLDGIAARLIPRVRSLVMPVERLLGPLDVVAVTGVAHVTAPIQALVLPRPATGGCRSIADPPRAGPLPVTGASPSGSGRVGAGTSDPLPAAALPAGPADQLPGTTNPFFTHPVLCGQWPSPLQGPVMPSAHMSGQGHGPLSPGDRDLPLSGGSNQALHTPSQTDGTGDAPPSWEARVTETFAPLWIVDRPAVRTAADEPAFSPD